jgi:hypothetical protein
MRPRHYATEILKIGDLEGRRKYLSEKVPAEWQEWVSIYVRQWWKNRKSILDGIEKRKKGRHTIRVGVNNDYSVEKLPTGSGRQR